MIPAPNVLAGVLIGIVNDSWLSVLGVSAVWPLIFCVYISIMDRARRDATVAQFTARGRHLLMGSPTLTFYAGEFVTALLTALPVAMLAHGLKRLVS